ncbi:hypothetical protein Aab01nite_02790 [Paractinoplanes abujensis]|uniref:Uncharacterized protein (UPF0548 family) n=1 Tax=Paractinoplanes abujensis TaxID=882441 RepID=A0A7W7CNN0_9ACTN|nr:DUF1990 domain-containing protein [Actinoplanes abujensis]MBB4691889.1 uncharacterized protein (UPF0548 family) [Actinoplanes abujensis]GID16689.1 hypothetical protein Aab01nite_02790 [Actinoplanes abujensis]
MSLTYAEVGATRDEPMPAGYGHVERDELIGHGRAAFDRAVDSLLDWRMHRAAGFRIVRGGQRAAEGADIVLRFFGMTVPCRVVYVVDEPDRRGFGYGTLPGHPERGEEAFLVVLTAGDEVRFRIRAFSRPATALARLGGPITRLGQRYATDRYVKALRRLTRSQ